MPNKGEWAEIYAFLKLLTDGTMYIADENLRQVDDAYFRINQMFREENVGHVLQYKKIERTIRVQDNGRTLRHMPALNEYEEITQLIWRRISTVASGEIEIPEARAFLRRIGIEHIDAPAMPPEGALYFGGTEDLALEIEDYRNGLQQTLGFSCKSILGGEPTLLNASGATNFVYKLTGHVNDQIMASFNSMFDKEGHFAIKQRIQFLKENNINIEFEKPSNEHAMRNLILSGGKEMPQLVGELLKYYFWVCEAENGRSSLNDALTYLVNYDILQYGLPNVRDIYTRKLRTLLFDVYAGMRFAVDWNGESAANGGFVIVNNSGQVLTYFNNIANQFRNYLLNSTKFETPSAKRHCYMSIYKENGDYKIKFNLQIRFKRQR